MKTVKEMSELAGISIRTLRYYDEIGLLIPSDRSPSGYRLYDNKDIEKLSAILFLKELGMPLDNIKSIVNSENCDYSLALRDYREEVVRKINKLQGLLNVIDDITDGDAKINFDGFDMADAKYVAEIMTNDVKELLKMQELVEHNMIDGKAGIELLQIYGSKEKYLAAVEEGARQPQKNKLLQEELKEIYFAFRDSSGDLEKTNELVKRLEDNTKNMYRTSNARYILLKIAEGYLTKDITAQVIDDVYGKGVTDIIGNAINVYYGIDDLKKV